MRHEQHLLSEAESRQVIDDVDAWLRRTGTNYNRLITAARVNASTRHCVRIKHRRLTIDTAHRLRDAMQAHPRGIGKGEHKARVRAAAAEQLERQRAKRRRDFPALPITVDRSPCPRCGVRRDLGCDHYPRF
ncbi:hypothetical protein ATM17_21510 [Sphingopyxis macrogoltabida]|uniref:Uncharacterized protein n=1 Tax=Sphingopyxis macrogoltabida TaxID=33050 RepID=A0AAC9AX81_SPHMC|nr:hypothetical protein LH19_20930 [Sphingopyxis macrogoltabida]AMU91596.1 hypothetical protein ATM17_21510 [Sphingopyxis macrogoltabida]